ncbi:MAG: phBC6A51 family helix-turn-helix protein [Sedimentibacter sp.]|uniref:phBC6A51 family helix-turn-helix protein n=1 Tax=Sedimentibacter sp. TaxID=1960295 RepID=UPI0031590E1A
MANNNRDDKGRFTFNDELTPIQLEVIAEIINNGGNKTKACEKLGVPRCTLYKWLDNEMFVQAYRKACEKMYKEHLADAIRGIVDVAKNGAGRDKVKACETILKLNDYLDTKVDITENTNKIIKIEFIDNDNTDTSEKE